MAYVPQQIRGRGRMGCACRPRPVLFPLHTASTPNSKSRGPAGHTLGEVTLLGLLVLPSEASVDSAPPTPRPRGADVPDWFESLCPSGRSGAAGSRRFLWPQPPSTGPGREWGGMGGQGGESPLGTLPAEFLSLTSFPSAGPTCRGAWEGRGVGLYREGGPASHGARRGPEGDQGGQPPQAFPPGSGTGRRVPRALCSVAGKDWCSRHMQLGRSE